MDDGQLGFSGSVQFSPLHKVFKIVDPQINGSSACHYIVFSRENTDQNEHTEAKKYLEKFCVQSKNKSLAVELKSIFTSATQHWGLVKQSLPFEMAAE